VPTPTSLGVPPRVRPVQAAPVRRGQPAGEGGILCGGAVGWGDGCASAVVYWVEAPPPSTYAWVRGPAFYRLRVGRMMMIRVV
jgi:hypothetical protein